MRYILICLQDQFDKNGKIITRHGDIFDAVEIMKGYCRTLDKCSLGELLQYEKDLIGETRHQTALKTGNAVLIRTDKDVFVSDQSNIAPRHCDTQAFPDITMPVPA